MSKEVLAEITRFVEELYAAREACVGGLDYSITLSGNGVSVTLGLDSIDFEEVDEEVRITLVIPADY
jgi:hypothetical protein